MQIQRAHLKPPSKLLPNRLYRKSTKQRPCLTNAEKNRINCSKTTLDDLVKTRKSGVIPVEAYTTIFRSMTSREMPVILKAELLLINAFF